MLANRRGRIEGWRWRLALVVAAMCSGGGYGGNKMMVEGVVAVPPDSSTPPLCHGPGDSGGVGGMFGYSLSMSDGNDASTWLVCAAQSNIYCDGKCRRWESLGIAQFTFMLQKHRSPCPIHVDSA